MDLTEFLHDLRHLMEDTTASFRQARHAAEEAALAFDRDFLTDPAVIIAGIEGRLIVREGMRDILDWIEPAEPKNTEWVNDR
jgi:hypothetical protein